MLFNIENVGTTFVFPGQEGIPEEKRASLTMRAITTDKTREIMKKVSTPKSELRQLRKNGPFQRVEWNEIDEDILFEETWDYILVDWKNVEVNNVPLPCTRENKLMLLGNDNLFASCAIKWRDQLQDVLSDSSEEQEKN